MPLLAYARAHARSGASPCIDWSPWAAHGHPAPHYLIVSNAPHGRRVDVAPARPSNSCTCVVAGFRRHAAHARTVAPGVVSRAPSSRPTTAACPRPRAIYRTPECHAYVADGPNRVHWMVHEAAHQLSRRSAWSFERERWIDEGLAGYFGASRIDAQGLRPALLDPKRVSPTAWFPQFQWSGNLEQDLREGRLIPLAAPCSMAAGPHDRRLTRTCTSIEYSRRLTHFLLPRRDRQVHGRLRTAARQRRDAGRLRTRDRPDVAGPGRVVHRVDAPRSARAC